MFPSQSYALTVREGMLDVSCIAINLCLGSTAKTHRTPCKVYQLWPLADGQRARRLGNLRE